MKPKDIAKVLTDAMTDKECIECGVPLMEYEVQDDGLCEDCREELEDDE